MKKIKKIRLSHVMSFLLLISTLACANNDIFISQATDSDGDGIINSLDSNPDDPCLPIQTANYKSFNPFNQIWASSDCDGDGITNSIEYVDKNRNPYVNEDADTDGDGILDIMDESPNNPCVPKQEIGYNGFDPSNEIWGIADCDDDGISNAVEFSNGKDPYKGCNLNFDFSNFEGELQAKDSNNGASLINLTLLESCDEIAVNGDFLNLGCTNDDIQFLIRLEPFVDGGNEGNAIIKNATFSCTNNNGVTTDYTFNADGFFSGNDGFMEFFGYTLTGGGKNINGNFFISQVVVNEITRCDFASEYNTIININGAENNGNATLTQHPRNCNEYVLSGDFLNLECTNNLNLTVFFGEKSNGSEVIIGETTFTCIQKDGSLEQYIFRGFGNYSTTEGFIEISEFSLTDSSGNETNGSIFFEK